MPADRPAPPRQRLLQTSSGTSLDAFGAAEWGLLAAIATIWGSSFLFMEIGLRAFEPGLVTLLRVGLGACALLLVPRARNTSIDREDWPRVALLGLVWIGIPLLLFPVAQQWIDSSVAGMINGAMPLTVAAWSVLLLRRPPGPRQTLGLALGFVGILAITLPEVPVGRLSETATPLTALGAGLVLIATVLYGLAANLAVPLQQRYGALPVLLRSQAVALVLIVPVGLLSIPGSRFDAGAALAMVPLGVLGTGLAFVLMATLVGRVGGTRGSIAIYFVPVVALVLGVIILGEQVHPLAVAGTVLVVIGAWATSRREGSDQPRLARGAAGHTPS